MKAMPASWWQDRAPRERALLAVMLALLGAVAAWLLVLRPLAAARSAAAEAARAAQEQLAQARALSAAMAAQPAASAAPVAEILARRLAQAGVQPQRLEGQGDGQAVVEIAAINGRLLIGWAAALEARDGLVIDALTSNRNPDQSVRARLVVRKAA